MKRSRLQKAAAPVLLVLLCVIAVRVTGCSFAEFWSRRAHLGDLIVKMFPPDVSYFTSIGKPILVTLQMSVTGTVLGAVLALLLAPLCAANLQFTKGLRLALRVVIQVLRSFPTLILALAATFLFGLGTFAGTFAITVYTFAVITRLTYEDIEAAATGAYRAVTLFGTGRYTAFFRTVLPEILPSYLTNSLYLLETNVRHSSILGYVGAGGIGLLLNEKISWREYSRVGTILVALFVTVCFIEWLSTFLVAIVKGERPMTVGGKRMIAVLFALVFVLCTLMLDGPDLAHTSPKIVSNMAHGFLQPAWSFMTDLSSGGLLNLLLETLCIAFLGTLLGAIPALLLALLNSTSLMKKLPALLFRLVVMAIRSVPFIIYGLVFIRVTGAGAFAGVLTLAMCSIGLMTKRFTEAIDALDLRSYRALRQMGTSALPAVTRAVFPQLWPVLLSSVLYRFDINVREASVLGLVGAGGIGAVLIQAMNKYAWDTSGAIFWGMIVIVWVVDVISGRLRKKIASV